MKVCLATNQTIALSHGGIRTQILQTKAALEQLGVSVDLFDMWETFDPSAYDLVHLFSANIGTYHLARTLRSQNVRFVVSPVFYSRRSPLLVRTVIRADRFFNHFMRGIWTDYGLMAEMCEWARAVLPNSEAEKQFFTNALGVDTKNVHVVPNGVEERFASASADLFNKTHRMEGFTLAVTHVGPERKNVLRLLQALDGVDGNVVIIGPVDETPEGKRCREIAAGNSRIRLLGALPHDSDLLVSAYAACDIFVLPSLFETPGIAALEAGLAGAKIVITKHGGPQEYFAEHAEYVESDSVESIRSGILRARERAKTDALRTHIRERYLWTHVAERTLAAYEQAITA
jgi:glycosyltransferase involved in cell wall biosynthesis